jgi:O-antigen ligase
VLAALVVLGVNLNGGSNGDAAAMMAACAFGVLALVAIVGINLRRVAWRRPSVIAAVAMFGALLVIQAGRTVYFYGQSGAPRAGFDVSGQFLGTIRLASVGLAFIVGMLFAMRHERARKLIKACAWVFGAIALIALFNTDRVVGRLAFPFGSPNSAATFFGVGLLLNVSLTLKRGHAFVRGATLLPVAVYMASVVSAAMCTAALVLTKSRAGLSAVGAALVLNVVWEIWTSLAQSGRKRSVILPVLVGLLLLGGGQALAARFASYPEDASLRWIIVNTHWNAVQSAPLFGNGLGSFDQINKQSMTMSNFYALWQIRAAHNFIVQWLEQAGIVGTLLMFGSTALVLLRVAIGAVSGRFHRTWIRALVCASALIVLHGFVDFGLEEPSIALTWALLLGIGVGLSTLKDERRRLAR